MDTTPTPVHMTRRLHITTRDSAGVIMEDWYQTLKLDPANDRNSDEGLYPADEVEGRRIVQEIAESIFGNVREGLKCSVTVEPVCTFPGCDAPVGVVPTLCNPCAEATL